MAFNGNDGSSPICDEQRTALDPDHQFGFSLEELLHLRIDLWRAYSQLPSTLRSCFLGLFGSTVTDAARHSGSSRAKVYDQIAALRDQFRNAGLHDYNADSDTFEVFPVSEA